MKQPTRLPGSGTIQDLKTEDPLEALRAELARLKEKRAAITDRDVIAALDLRISQIEQELPPLPDPVPSEPANEVAAEEAKEAPPEEQLPPPTPEQLKAADALIRQAKVEKMRGNAQASTDLLKKATEVAPSAPAVLEALGDDLVERKRLGEALVVYKKALTFDPKNVGLEKKHADGVYKLLAAGSIDDQLRRNLSDSPFIDGDDSTASIPTAIILSAILPGLGHLVLGQTKKGFGIMAAYILAAVWLFALQGDDLAKMIKGSSKANMIIFIPILIMGIVLVVTFFSLKGMSDRVVRKNVDRPRPPVDLPFE